MGFVDGGAQGAAVGKGHGTSFVPLTKKIDQLTDGPNTGRKFDPILAPSHDLPHSREV